MMEVMNIAATVTFQPENSCANLTTSALQLKKYATERPTAPIKATRAGCATRQTTLAKKSTAMDDAMSYPMVRRASAARDSHLIELRQSAR